MKHIGELEKHVISEVIYLEHDPEIIAAEGAHDTLAGKMTINVKKSDPISFMRRNNEVFDAECCS